MEIYDPYKLFEVDGENVRLKYDTEGLEGLCNEKKNFQILKIENNKSLIKLDIFCEPLLTMKVPYLNSKLKKINGETITYEQFLKKNGFDTDDINRCTFYEPSYGRFTIHELLESLGGKPEYTEDNSNIMIDLPIYRLESNFIFKEGGSISKNCLDKDLKLKKEEDILCKNLVILLHEQGIYCENVWYLPTYMAGRIDPIACVRIEESLKERFLIPAFLRPKSGYKYITPCFYKPGIDFTIDHDLDLISKIASIFLKNNNILRNENIIKKDKVVEKTKETEILGLPGDSYEAKIITTIETEIMFYNLFKDNLTIN